MITYDRLKEVLNYDSNTGLFRWKVSMAKRIKVGDVAGCININGYIYIRIDGKLYLAHRLAWFYVYGYMPENFIDHINRNVSSNKISNLREVSKECCLRNTENRKNNTSGVKGVTWDKKSNKWLSLIYVDKKNKNLGKYEDFDDAVCARLAAEQCSDWSGCYSNSPAYRYVKKMLRGNNV